MTTTGTTRWLRVVALAAAAALVAGGPVRPSDEAAVPILKALGSESQVVTPQNAPAHARVVEDHRDKFMAGMSIALRGRTDMAYQREHRDGHAERDVDVGRWHDLHVGNPDCGGPQRDPVDRDQVHEIHQEHPHENRQSQRGDQAALAAECVFDGAVDEIDDHLNKGLKLAGLSGADFPRHTVE